jgi:hypothetical protein
MRVNHHGMENLERQFERASRGVTLSLVALGLYIAASLLMQHSIGPRIFDFPLLAALGHALALWLTFHLIKSARTGTSKKSNDRRTTHSRPGTGGPLSCCLIISKVPLN